MANMNFGVNILPKANNTYSLGNSDYKWNLYTNSINGTTIDNLVLPTVSSTDNGKILKVDNGAWAVGAAPSGLPSVSSTDNGKMLQVSNGAWAAVTYTAPVTSVNGNTGAVTTTDEKVKYTNIDGDQIARNVLLGDYTTSGSKTTSAYVSSRLICNDGILYIMNYNNTKAGALYYDALELANPSNTYTGQIHTSTNLSANRIYTLPNATGTIALTSDIPLVPSWALESTKPTYTASEVGAVPTEVHSGSSLTPTNSSSITNVTKKINLSVWNDSDGSYGISKISITPTLVQLESSNQIILGCGNSDTVSFTQQIIIGSNVTIHNVKVPTADGDAANKQYVDNQIAGIVIPSTMTGATSSANGASGLVPAPTSADVDKFLAGDGTYKSGGKPMVILSYGNSTWDDFEAAYNNNVIVYCRASSNSNPATGSQTRMAFMAYVNNSTTPTEVEFQYYRSMSSHSATAMGDQVFVYKLTKTGGWSVTTRDASIKEINVASGSKLEVSWSGNKVTLSNTMTAADMPMSSSDATTVSAAISALGTLPAVTSADNGKILRVVNGEWAVVSISDASGVSF